jgi:glucokinase
MINIFRPEVVLIGGGISNEGDYILEYIQNYVDQNAYGHNFVKSSKILCANLKNDAGIIGAAMLVL